MGALHSAVSLFRPRCRPELDAALEKLRQLEATYKLRQQELHERELRLQMRESKVNEENQNYVRRSFFPISCFVLPLLPLPLSLHILSMLSMSPPNHCYYSLICSIVHEHIHIEFIQDKLVLIVRPFLSRELMHVPSLKFYSYVSDKLARLAFLYTTSINSCF